MTKLLHRINGGTVYLRNGDHQDFTEINFRGRLVVLDGAMIDSAKVNDGGQCRIESGGWAGSIEAEKNCVVIIRKGARVGHLTSVDGSNVTIEAGSTVDAFVQHGGHVTIVDDRSIKSHTYLELC